jgi:hypothetical protein
VTPDGARAAAYTQFLSEWGTTTTVRLEGREEAGEPGVGTPWVRVAFRNYGGGQHTLGPTGSRIYRRTGAVFVQVFAPIERGPGYGATLAQAARAIFEGRRFGELDFFDGQIIEIPLRSGERNTQTNVEVRCAYDETK